MTSASGRHGGGGTSVHHRSRDIRLLPSPPHPTNGQPPVSLNVQCDVVPFSVILFHDVNCKEVALIALMPWTGDWQTFSMKGHIVDILGCAGQLVCCNYLTLQQWRKTALDDTYMNECGRKLIPLKPYLSTLKFELRILFTCQEILFSF